MEKSTENNLMLQIGITILLAIITIGATYFIVEQKTNNIAEKVVAKMLAIEYDKVGGMENYVKITDIQKKQVIEGMKQYDAQNGGAQPAANSPKVEPVENTSISPEKATKITSDGTYIYGNPDAEITWVEYSDLECPFCKRLHEAGTIDEVIEAYDGNVNFIFKQFPLSFHAQAAMEAEALLCVGELSNGDKYYEFIDKIFANSQVNGRSYTKETISDLGTSVGVNNEELLSCINSGKYAERVQNEMDEGKTFGITGTPGNVLINNKTGKWDKLPGAYPTASFKEKIDSLLK